MKKDDLYIKTGKFNKSLIENNKVIIGTYIRIYKYEKGLINNFVYNIYLYILIITFFK